MSILLDLFGIELPIIQAPMAGVQGHALAVAVSEAGGLGSLPCAALNADAMRAELAAVKGQTNKPFNVNFFCHAPPILDSQRESAWRNTLRPYYEELGIDLNSIPDGPGRTSFNMKIAELLRQVRPPVVSFHFGLPAAELLDVVRSWGAKVLSSATTVKEARWLEERGVDAIIAQGDEAGGHRGHFLTTDETTRAGTRTLVKQFVDTVKVPIIAAGGIADRQGVTAALGWGAAGVQIGTAYLLSPQATTSIVHRAALNGDAARHTELTNLFTGRPARGIVNRLMRELGAINPLAPPFPLATAAIAPLRAKAESLGRGDFSPLWAGTSAAKCREISAFDLTKTFAGF